MGNKYKKLLGNTVWTIAGNSLSKVLSFLLLPLYTRWLGSDGFGLSDLISTYSSLLVGALSFCIAEGIFVFTKNENSEEKTNYFSSLINFSIILFSFWALLFLVIKKASIHYFISNAFTDNLWLIFGMIVTGFAQSYTQQFVISLNKVKVYAFTGLVLCVATFALSCLLIPKFGVEGYVYSFIIANFITSCYSLIASNSYKYYRILYIDFQRVRKLLRYSIPLIPNAIMWWLVQALNRPVMENYLDYSQIGIYAVANKFPAVITMLFSLFSVSWNISVFEEYKNSDFQKFYSNIFHSIFFMVSVVSVILIICSKPLIMLFTTPEFEDSWKIMNILIVGSFFSCMSGFFGTCFSVKKESKYFFYSSLFGAIVSIILNFILIPRIGVYGAAISTAASFIVMAVSRYIYSKKIIDCKFTVHIIAYLIILILLALLSIKCDTFLYRILYGFSAICLIFMLNFKMFNLLKSSIIK